MKRKTILALITLLVCTSISGCKDNKKEETAAAQAPSVTEASAVELSVAEESVIEEPAVSSLEDGTYTVKFDTDNSMFHVNEVCEGKASLTVKDGQMTVHLIMPSKNVLNLYPGLAEDAKKDGAALLEPSVESVTYSDGYTEEVFAYDVPVPYLDKEFDLALIGTKEKWYDHKVVVSSPIDEIADDNTSASVELPDAGAYTIELDFEGGSGKAYIESPTTIDIDGDKITATVTWSSPNYDYMLVDGEKYLPINTDGNSVFQIPISSLDEPITIIGDTVAMSTPHEIEYTITLHSDSLKTKE